jgi:hypothetical protein
METAKIKIRQYTEAYKTVEPFKSEYLQFLKGVKAKQALNTSSNKHAAVQGGVGVTERLLTEVPETLHVMLFRQLTDEEWMWFQSIEARKWFANSYKEFSATGGKV